MKITCRLLGFRKALYEKDSKWEETPLYNMSYYEREADKENFDTQYELQVVALREDQDENPHVLSSKTFTKSKGGKQCHYIHFMDVTYVYSEGIDQIYCTTLEREI